MSLAAAAKLPVAKNLQSKPELAEITAIETDGDEEVIDGNELPVGEHARQVEGDTAEVLAAAPAISSAGLTPASPLATTDTRPKGKGKSGPKVPNFNTFRKKLILGISAGVLFIGFMVWAIFIAPRATVVVSAKTDDQSVNIDVKAGDALTTSIDKSTIKAVVSKKVEEKSVDFPATGTKNVGEKATGTVQFSTNNISALGTTIPAGTRLTSSQGTVFVTNSSVTISIDNYTGAPTGVTALEQGAKYNAASGAMSGAPSGIDASLTGPTSGGTDKIAKVVTANDLQQAKEDLVDDEADSKESELKAGFKGKVSVISGSYGVDYTNVTSSPAVGAEAASGNATLKATVTYRLLGIETSELDSYLDKYLKKELDGQDSQRVYDNGEAKAKFQEVEVKKGVAEFILVATAKIGPKLDEGKIKDQAKGRQFGDIQESIQSIQGVEDVDVKFFPFWVSTVPGDESKIGVEFIVDESN